MGHMWLGTEGVFGVALGVSAGLIFLFVLFGALLETAGAGSYFIRSAVALLGHMRGGPAKAAVVASAATGLISGSSITNVVTTGHSPSRSSSGSATRPRRPPRSNARPR